MADTEEFRRLKTFSSIRPNNSIAATNLAYAGFERSSDSTPETEVVICIECGLAIENFPVDQNPFLWHQVESNGNCQYILKRCAPEPVLPQPEFQNPVDDQASLDSEDNWQYRATFIDGEIAHPQQPREDSDAETSTPLSLEARHNMQYQKSNNLK